MQRQTFLRTLNGLAAVPFARSARAAASAVKATTTRLHLRREPDNPYDPRAVNQLLDAGRRLYAQTTVLRSSIDPWQRVRLRIDLAA